MIEFRANQLRNGEWIVKKYIGGVIQEPSVYYGIFKKEASAKFQAKLWLEYDVALAFEEYSLQRLQVWEAVVAIMRERGMEV